MLKSDLPPYGNTGAQNTYKGSMRACLDWLGFTFTDVTDPHFMIEFLDLSDCAFREDTGQNGYRSSLKFGGISVMYDGGPNMGVHVEMSGQGCREYESLRRWNWQVLLQSVLSQKSNITRLDVAIDDFFGYFKIPYLWRLVRQGRCRSKFKKARTIEQAEIVTGNAVGTTIYFGQPSSRIQIRMYEKNFERMDAGFELEPGVDVWNRIEIQLRHERAHSAALLIAQGEVSIGQAVVGILRHYVSFVDKGNDTNRSRWPISEFWLKFLNDVAPLRLSFVAPDRTIQRSYSWVDRQVDITLAKLFVAFGGKLEVLYDFLDEGLDKLNESHIEEIERFQSLGISYEDFRAVMGKGADDSEAEKFTRKINSVPRWELELKREEIRENIKKNRRVSDEN